MYEASDEARLNLSFLPPRTTASVPLKLPFPSCRMTYSCQSQAFPLRTWFKTNLSGEVLFTTVLRLITSLRHVILTVFFNSYYFWYSCELMIHCHLTPASSPPSWPHGSSRAEITLFHTVAYPVLCVEILNKYPSLPLDPKTSSLCNSVWWPFLNSRNPWNIKMLTDMWVWRRVSEAFLELFLFLQIFSKFEIIIEQL